MNKLDKIKPYSHVLIRIGMSLVFLWFGFNQVIDPASWTSIVPAWASGVFGNAATVVTMNGWFEIVAGLLLLVGYQVRIISLFLGLHLIVIASGFGLSRTGVRDWGLCIATFSIFLHGADIWSLDTKIWGRKKVEETPNL